MRAGDSWRHLVRLLVLVWALALMPGAARASSGDFEAANRLYDEGKFSEAKQLYEQLVDGGAWSANLFYNLGNADYRLGATGRAILNYERALALDHAHPEARANVALLRQQSGAKLPQLSWWQRVVAGQPTLFWTVLATAAGWLALWAQAIILVRRQGGNSGWWFAAALGVVVGTVAIGALWTGDQDRALAVIVAKSTEARLAPADSAALAEALPAGSRVWVLSERGDWIYCALPGLGRGWIPHTALERVRLGKS